MWLQLFADPASPDETPDDHDLFFNLFDVEDKDKVDEFGEPIPEEKKPEDQEPKQEDKPQEQQPEQKPEEQTPPTPEQAPEKKPQTPEENARFAEQRRQKEAQDRAEKLAQERLQQTPEYQIAQTLAQQYGMPVEQLLQKMQEAVMQKQAKEQGVPVEVLQQIETERQARLKLEQELNQDRFKNWLTQKQTESATLKAKYPVLTDEDLNAAMNYQLETLKNPGLPLEQVVYALHGPKIAEHLQKTAKQEALAEIGGRKQSPLPPQGAKPATVDHGLTADEKYIARKMGMTEADYAKYKTANE